MKKLFSFLLIVCLLLSMTLFNFNIQTACASESIQYASINSGVFYLKNSYSGKYLSVESGSILGFSDLVQNTKKTGEASYSQMWKIESTSDGYYTIRPYHKLDMAIFKNSLTANVDVRYGVENTSLFNPDLYRWQIDVLDDGSRVIIPKDYQDKMLGLEAKNTAENTKITAVTANQNDSANKWVFEAVASPPSGIMVHQSTAYLSPYGTETFVVSIYSPDTNSQQVNWTSSEEYVAKVDEDGLVYARYPGSCVITATSEYNSAWSASITVNVTDLPFGYYYFRNKGTNGFMDIASESVSENATIHQYQYDGSDSQYWIVELQNNGYYTIQSVYSGLYLSVSSNTSAPNTSVTQLERDLTDRQLWKFIRLSNGAFKIVPKCGEISGQCLAVNTTTSGANGIAIRQKTYVGDDVFNDEWYLPAYDNKIVTLNVTYDEQYYNRFPMDNQSNNVFNNAEAENLLNHSSDAIFLTYMYEFSVYVEVKPAFEYSSYADRNCNVSHNQLCGCIEENQCISHDATYHHTHYDVNFRDIPINRSIGIYRMLYMGQDVCKITEQTDDEHPRNPYNGMANAADHRTIIYNKSGNLQETARTVVHEFGHLFWAPDHRFLMDDLYVSSCTHGEECYQNGMCPQNSWAGYNNACIYGIYYSTEDVYDFMTICRGCRNAIKLYLYDYAH